MKNNFIYIVLCLVVMPVLTTCSKDGFSGSKKSEAKFDASFTDQTVYFDASETEKDVVSINSANTFTFKSTSEKAQKLKKGDIILLHGTALRKADKVTTQGGNIVVETVAATLDELIEDGTIEWSSYCDFNPNMQLSIMVGDSLYAPITRAGKDVSFNFDFGDYNYAISMTMNGEDAKVKLEVTKKILGSNVKAKLAAEGTMYAFYSQNKITYQKGKLKDYTNANKNLKGDLTLSATLAGSGNASINFVPAVMLGTYPLMVGPIPVLITVKMQIVINVVVPMDGSASISTRFKYDSETGFTYNGTQTSAKGRIGSYSFDKDGVDVGASSSIAVNFGIGFPRIEIGLFGNVIVPWIQTAFLINGDYTFYPACKRVQASYIGAYGVNLSFLGFSAKPVEEKNLWQQDIAFIKSGECY